jgi:hypothetical protein
MSRRIGEDEQDKDEAVARTFNWTPDLDGATITGASWTTGGMSSQSETTTSPYTSIRAAGALPGQKHRLECRVTTSTGEILEAHIEIKGTD